MTDVLGPPGRSKVQSLSAAAAVPNQYSVAYSTRAPLGIESMAVVRDAAGVTSGPAVAVVASACQYTSGEASVKVSVHEVTVPTTGALSPQL